MNAKTNGIYRAAERHFHPWKNGGGQTAEILTLPAATGSDAGKGAFDLRLSTAIVASDGPFSDFTGIERVLTVIEGGPMVLRIDGQDHRLTDQSPPFAFSGDLACMARLIGPELLDFNVMTRPPLRANVTRGRLTAPAGRPFAAYALLLAPAAGLARLDLVDLLAADPSLLNRLRGAEVVQVTCTLPTPPLTPC